MVNEKHLRTGNEPRLSNYRLYRIDRLEDPGGGTAIYVKADLSHCSLEMSPLKHIKVTGVVLGGLQLKRVAGSGRFRDYRRGLGC